MSTEYIASATAASDGAEFTLDSGSSRVFYTKPSIPGNSRLNLQIKNSAGTWTSVGTLVGDGESTGVVTARGAGSSTFRVSKSVTSSAVTVYYD